MVDFLQKDPIVTGDYYSNLLQNLIDSFAKKRPASWQCSTTQSTSDSAEYVWMQILTAAPPPLFTSLGTFWLLSVSQNEKARVFAILEQMMLLLMRWFSVVRDKKFLLHAFLQGLSEVEALVEEVCWTSGRPHRKILRLYGDQGHVSQVSSLPITHPSHVSERKLTGLGIVSGHFCHQTDTLYNIYR
jgi:hypothetical protein